MRPVREQKRTLRSSLAGGGSLELQFTVELRQGEKPRILGTSAVLAVAVAVFEAAKRDAPPGELVLREGPRVLMTWPSADQPEAQ